MYVWSGNGQIKVADTPSYAKTADLSGSIFSSPVLESHRKTDTVLIMYSSSSREKHLIGNIAMVIVKFRPRWPHTWRYALHSLSRPTMTSGRLGEMYSRSRRRAHSAEVRRDSLTNLRPTFWGQLVLFN